MSRSSQLFARVALGSCLTVLPLGFAWSAERTAVVASANEVLKYTSPSGESFVAIGLQAKDLPEVKQTRHHVVLVDTSASQFGEHRTQAFALLQSFLRGLPSDDRVSLFAVDVQATRLTPEFVAPNSESVRDAIAALRQRAPLGATNFKAALNAASEALPKDSVSTVLYIGDGMSSVNLLTTDSLRQSVNDLRSRQVPVSSYAVGPRRDLKLLGTLAQHTGGVVLVDDGGDSKSAASDPNVCGQQLARAATSSVFYPDRLEVAGSDVMQATALPLPLRADRATFVLAQGQLANDGALVAAGEFAGQPLRMLWSVDGLRSESASPFVAAAFRQANKDGGFVPYAGRELLVTAWNEFDQRIELLGAEGMAAQTRHQQRDAERIGRAIQELDPDNTQIKLLLTPQTALKVKPVSRQVALAEAQPPDESLLNREEFQPDVSSNRSLILDEITRQQIIGEKLRLEVSKAIQEARALAGIEPANAITILKRAYGAVKSTVDASIELRQQLAKQLQGVIADVRAQEEVTEKKKIYLAERLAVQEAEERLQEKLQLEDEKLESLIDRVRALLHDGERGNDAAYIEAEAAAEAAQQMKPNSGVSAAARFNTEANFQLNMTFRLRNLRAEKFLKTLEQVELSHVPFPDEPPVLFPAPEVWKALSERRKKYASVDLHKSSKAEDNIAAQLDKQTEIAFTDTPLTDVVQFLSDYHGIPIIIDNEALVEEGIQPDSPVTRTLTGVKLRSALKIILQPLLLSYVIEDEVMKITTATKEKDRLQTRVYPVGDLVVILQPGGGLGGGGGGGFGGQQGGQQQGGQGGGGFGGQGGGGGGGGFFNIPVNLPARQGNAQAPAFNNQKVNEAKKKLNPRK
ncbi:MAG: VWA domain-containing protein [Planctomycetaceae bacterium]